MTNYKGFALKHDLSNGCLICKVSKHHKKRLNDSTILRMNMIDADQMVANDLPPGNWKGGGSTQRFVTVLNTLCTTFEGAGSE